MKITQAKLGNLKALISVEIPLSLQPTDRTLTAATRQLTTGLGKTSVALILSQSMSHLIDL